jgi:antitoxin component YwqK of YwqJK toxin-antitoxin module
MDVESCNAHVQNKTDPMKNYVSLLMLFSVLSCCGQKPLKDFYLTRSLKQDGLSYKFTVLDSDKKGIWKYQKEKFYFWYKAQHVLSTQGSSSGVVLNGEFEAFYQSKQLASKGEFNKGLKQGQWLYWRKDGTLEKSERWSAGTQMGTQKFYDTSGQENESIVLRHGKSKRKLSDSLIVTKRNSQSITVYDSIGNIKRIEKRKHGALDGKVKTYEAGKRIATETYKNGIKIEAKAVDGKSEDKPTKNDSEKFGAKMKAWFTNLFSKKEKMRKAPDKESEDDSDKPKKEKKAKASDKKSEGAPIKDE